MFGYVKPDKDNLLVKDLNLYKASYCGLCSVIKKKVSFILPFKLSYDFVFLSMLRSTLTKEKSVIKKGRCKYNPIKKTNFLVCEKETLFTAHSALILTALKLEDDLKDRDLTFFKGLFIRPLYKHFIKKVKRLSGSEKYSLLIQGIKEKLDRLSSLEEAKSGDIDLLCEIFGDILYNFATFELEGEKKKIAGEIASSIGRYIYLADATDDLERDEKNNSYNPLIIKYGSVESVKENFDELDVAISMYAKRALLAFNLLSSSEYTRILENILSLGLGREFYRIMTKNGDRK